MARQGVLANHRLRHLEGISLRNLSLSRAPSRPRGQTIDDEELSTSFATMAKLQAADVDGRRLEHSKSSIDLTRSNEEAINSNLGPGSPKMKSRKGALRRRSTLNWSNETPGGRQKLLEEAVAEKRLDTFFSLHRSISETNECPLYVSEIKEKSMNPDFQHFSLASLGLLSAKELCMLRIWTRPGSSNGREYILLLEINIHLHSLKYIGKSLHNFYHSFYENTVVFHLSDGVYTSINSLSDIANREINDVPRSTFGQISNTSTFDAIMQLNNQAECIDDALETRDVLVKQLEAFIAGNKNTVERLISAKTAQASSGIVGDALGQIKREVNKLKHQKAQIRHDLKRRHGVIQTELAVINDKENSLADEEQDLVSLEPMQSELRVRITSHIRRISQTILDIYPIQPIENHPLCFTICDLFLPNASTFSNPRISDMNGDEDTSAAALGHVAAITSYVALKISISLPFTISTRGSTSTIFDPLTPNSLLGHSVPSAGYATAVGNNTGTASSTKRSLIPTNTAPTPENSPWRVFTLAQKGAPAARFAWAVYLLNKDLEELMSKCAIKIVDPRKTLANLKYLLTVLASGKGEMPARKQGLMKGLSVEVDHSAELEREVSPARMEALQESV